MTVIFHFVSLVDVDRNDDGACGELRRTIPDKCWVIQLEFANLRRHLLDEKTVLIAKQPQVAFK